MRSMESGTKALKNALFRRLSDDQCQEFYYACLDLLSRTGVRLHNEEALDLIVGAGASVSDGNRVRVPPELIERALSTAPKTLTLYDRDGRRAMPVAGRRSFFGPGSDCLNILDHRTGERRKPRLDDIEQAMVVADALPNVSFAMCMFLPAELDQRVVDRYQMAAMLRGTKKPLVYVTTELAGCVDAVEMAEAVAGGEQALRHKPTVACYINVTTGLNHNEEALQKLLYLTGKGLPAAYVPSTQGGATAPVTPAGSLLVSQAGALVGLVLSQLKREGAPFIMPGWGGNMLDMRSTIQPYADPDKRTLAAEFVHWLGLPMFSLAGCSESKVVDGQAAAEAALTLMTDALVGGNIIHDLGYLESGLTGSIAQLVICDEIVDWLRHFVRGIEINEETLALDLVEEKGPDGQYLDAEHTYEHYRERWYPSLFERENYEGWRSKGGKDLSARAADRVEEILESHQVEPLPAETSQRIDGIIERAEAALVG